jgi:hypothetical protein
VVAVAVVAAAVVVVVGAVAVLAVWDFDELPQAAAEMTTINVNGNATNRLGTTSPFPELAAAV